MIFFHRAWGGRGGANIRCIAKSRTVSDHHKLCTVTYEWSNDHRKLTLFHYSFILFTIFLNRRYIYCSSAGVYLKSDLLPHCEVSFSTCICFIFKDSSRYPITCKLRHSPLLECFQINLFDHIILGNKIPFLPIVGF